MWDVGLEMAECCCGHRRSTSRATICRSRRCSFRFVHRMVTTLASYTERPSWLTVGDVLEAGRAAPVPGASRQVQPRVVLTPSGERVTLDGEGPDVLELTEQGFYEVHAQGRDAAAPMTVASNVDLSESDLMPNGSRSVGTRCRSSRTPRSSSRRRPRSCSGMGLELEKSESALRELRDKGLA